MLFQIEPSVFFILRQDLTPQVWMLWLALQSTIHALCGVVPMLPRLCTDSLTLEYPFVEDVLVEPIV